MLEMLNMDSEEYNCHPFSGQALCGQCREETHRAKMFSQHDIIHISMKAKKLNSKVRKFRIDGC